VTPRSARRQRKADVQRDAVETSSGAVVDARLMSARASTPLNVSDGAICIIDTDGVGTLDESGCTYLTRTGFMAVRRAPWSGVVIAGPAPMRLVVFGWTMSALDALGSLASGLASVRTFYGRGSIELAWRAAAELRVGDTFSSRALDIYAQAVALNLTRFAARKQGLEPTRALRARRAIEKRLAEPLDLVALAGEVGCAPEYLSRLFRRTYGVSPSEFLLRRRTERARHLLAATRRPIADIAQQLGFYDTSHFARHFRHFSGISPAEFRVRQSEVNSVPE
jgi:AraC-like DNA-binding protein